MAVDRSGPIIPPIGGQDQPSIGGCGPPYPGVAGRPLSRGRISLILGCMFSGKTTELLRVLRDHPSHEILVFKPRIDTRYGRGVIGSHGGQGPHRPGVAGRWSHPAISVGSAEEVLACSQRPPESGLTGARRDRPAGPGFNGVGPRLVAVDEAHFFNSDLADVLKKMRDGGAEIFVTALDRDSWGRPFPVVERLRAIAQFVRERTTFCARCGAVADRTQRLTPIIDRTMVGGPESYEPRCGECWRPPAEIAP